MFYIIKQVLNEPPGWTRILKFWTRWQQKEPCLYGNLFLLCTKRKPPRDLEIEHVSRTVASVYSHMLNGLWLSQLHSGRPMHWHLQVNQNCVMELETLHWCLVDKLALCIGRTSMERLCHILNLPVLHLGEYLSSGHWWHQDEIVSCG